MISTKRCSPYDRDSLESRRQRLEALIGQLSASPNRNSYHNRQILTTAKYCLHQLRSQQQQQQQQYNRHRYNNNNNTSNTAEREYLNSYFSYGPRYDRSLFDATTSSTSSTSNSSTPSSITPLAAAAPSFNSPQSSSFLLLDENTTPNRGGLLNSDVYLDYHYLMHNHHHSTANEMPPPYESLMTKSSSLPSYCHLSNHSNLDDLTESKTDLDRSSK